MPRYFFNLFHAITAIDNEEGKGSDDAVATRIAQLSAREIVSANVLSGEFKLTAYPGALAEDGRPIASISSKTQSRARIDVAPRNLDASCPYRRLCCDTHADHADAETHVVGRRAKYPDPPPAGFVAEMTDPIAM